MPRPTVPAVRFVELVSWATDFDALRRILRELSKRSRLETLQLLLDGPKTTSQLPCRVEELHGLESLGLISCHRKSDGKALTWSVNREALVRLEGCLQ